MKLYTKEIMNTIRAVGAVFGDIGTSPLYALAVLITLTRPKEEQILGLLSLIIWTLIILVTIQYAWFAMNLSIKGEGGTIVLGQIATSITRNEKLKKIYRAFVFIGVGFLLGDGVITPAITILSSTEGIRLIPGFENTPQGEIIAIAILITLFLFILQPKGTGKIGEYFGPIMLLWFISIGLIGFINFMHHPQVIHAINPYYAIEFLVENPVKGFISLSEVLLVATGGEAMYADMGHLGRVSIRWAWFFVFPMLLLNYLGQTSFYITNPNIDPQSIFFESARHILGNLLYIPFLVLVMLAGIIASQSLISGAFSIIFQAINARLAPLMYIKHTSTELRTQIYIPAVNWMLMIGVLFMYFNFKTSTNMASAYGFAVSAVMLITGFFLTVIHLIRKELFYLLGSCFLLFVDASFFLSNFYKIPHGAYWSVIFALVPISVMVLYTAGQKRLYRKMTFLPLKEFIIKFEKLYNESPKIKGTAIFLIKDPHNIPPYVLQTLFEHGIIYEDNVFLSLVKQDEPFGVRTALREVLTKGLRVAEIRYGYMEVIDIDKELKSIGIQERVIFYGVENIHTDKPVWKLFSLLKRATPSFVEFYRFPQGQLHGVMVRVEF